LKYKNLNNQTLAMTIPTFFSKNKVILAYGTSLALLLFLLRWLELRFIIFDHAFEIYIGAIAIIFTALGIWLTLKLTTPKVKTIIVEKEIYINSNDNFCLNEKEVAKLGLSKRELEVLQLMAEGFSNGEIAERLFVSLHTIKTHTSNLFEKMDVKRRTQAVEKAKRLSLIA
jgi:two-component system, NarL family, response regulator LiaR